MKCLNLYVICAHLKPSCTTNGQNETAKVESHLKSPQFHNVVLRETLTSKIISIPGNK